MMDRIDQIFYKDGMFTGIASDFELNAPFIPKAENSEVYRRKRNTKSLKISGKYQENGKV